MTATLGFQFHNGSIKSSAPLLRLGSLSGFNSTMVRLKGVYLLQSGLTRQRFNSTMVRLKVQPFPKFKTASQLFQFHNGSIKRMQQPSESTLIISCFNSTMVRLKGDYEAEPREGMDVSIPQWGD